jgi:hypothetical protein
LRLRRDSREREVKCLIGREKRRRRGWRHKMRCWQVRRMRC